jgi:micrococcal nuclease
MLDWLFMLLLVLFGAPETPQSTDIVLATTTASVVRVIDGDTIDVQLGDTVERVRYIGIDTPEPYAGTAPECFAQEASAANRALVAERVVTLVRDQEDRDDYNRLLRYVYVGDTFVNWELARTGYATALPIPPNTRFAGELYAATQAAQTEALGLWGACI